jgi:predicted SAM-dependent methyltransferase
VDTVVLQWLKDFNEAKGPFKNVLELGSLDVNGTARDAFKNVENYTGMDMREGPGVDYVMSVSDIGERFFYSWKELFDCVIATSFFEHDKEFWHTLSVVRNLLRPSGYLLLTVPTPDFPYHGEPKDYWRFQEDALREVFFDGFSDVVITNPLWTPPEGHEHLRCQHMGGWGRLT